MSSEFKVGMKRVESTVRISATPNSARTMSPTRKKYHLYRLINILSDFSLALFTKPLIDTIIIPAEENWDLQFTSCGCNYQQQTLAEVPSLLNTVVASASDFRLHLSSTESIAESKTPQEDQKYILWHQHRLWCWNSHCIIQVGSILRPFSCEEENNNKVPT